MSESTHIIKGRDISWRNIHFMSISSFPHYLVPQFVPIHCSNALFLLQCDPLSTTRAHNVSFIVSLCSTATSLLTESWSQHDGIPPMLCFFTFVMIWKLCLHLESSDYTAILCLRHMASHQLHPSKQNTWVYTCLYCLLVNANKKWCFTSKH